MENSSIWNTRFFPAGTRRKQTTSAFRMEITSVTPQCEVTELILESTGGFSLDCFKGRCFILPVIGGCTIQYSSHRDTVVSEEMAIVTQCAQPITLVNNLDVPVKILLIHFLDDDDLNEDFIKFTLDFEKKNCFISADVLQIGIFDSRTKSIHAMDAETGILAFVIHGCFELEERLLNEGDSLLMLDKNNIEFEALTEFAILLLVSLPLAGKNQNSQNK